MHVYELISLARQGDIKALDILRENLATGNQWLEALIAYSHRFSVTRLEYTFLLQKLENCPRHLLQQLETWQTTQVEVLKPGLSAIVRLKNDVEHVKAAILSIYAFVDEIVCVLNASEDGTEAVVQTLAHRLSKIKVHYYPTILEPAFVNGDYFSRVVANPAGSLAAFYNFAFSRASYSHVIKWDGDMIATASCGKIFTAARAADVIFFDGSDLIGQQTTVPEPRLYRIQPGRFYVDTTHCEQLFLESSSPAMVREPLYIHMKLGKGTDFQKYLA